MEPGVSAARVSGKRIIVKPSRQLPLTVHLFPLCQRAPHSTLHHHPPFLTVVAIVDTLMDVRSLTTQSNGHGPQLVQYSTHTTPNGNDSDMEVDSSASQPQHPKATSAYNDAARRPPHPQTTTSSDASALGSPVEEDHLPRHRHHLPSHQPSTAAVSMDMSSDQDADADADDDDDDDDAPPRAPASRNRRPPSGDKLDLSKADPALYGLRRSVSASG